MKKMTFALAAALFLTFAAAQAEDKPAASGKDYIVMRINGKDVKKSEAETFFKNMFGSSFGGEAPTFDSMDESVRRNVLRGMATERILAEQAGKEGLEKHPDVQEKLELARQQILVQAFVIQKTKDAVTDDKLKAEYAKRVAEMGNQEEVHARHILVKTEAEANAIYDQVKKGADFEKLAKEKSDDKGSAVKGGDLGYFTADRMVPEFSKAAFALKKGEVSKPVKSDFGWHVIKVEDRRKATPPIFEQVKAQIREDIGNKVMQEYMLELMKKSDVKYVTPDGKEEPLIVEKKPEPKAEAKPAETKAEPKK